MSTVDVAAYRSVMGRLVTGVTVVSVVDDGVRYGMTVNSLTSVGLEPLLVLFCCQRDATLHGPLLRSGEWAVSVLAAAQDELSRLFATRGRPGVDRFTGQACRPGPMTGAPLIDNAIAWLECRTWATYDGGDHTIVVGEVTGLEPGQRDDALVYFRSGYGTLLQTSSDGLTSGGPGSTASP